MADEEQPQVFVAAPHLYGLMHGEFGEAAFLCRILDIQHPTHNPTGEYDPGRYRDIYPNADGSQIILHTRNGGGNRPDYRDTIRSLRKHPRYDYDEDDDFDCTYADFYFNTPAEYLEAVKRLASGKEPPTMRERTQAVLGRLNAK